MSKLQFSKGLHDLGNGCFAYLQPDGGWGLSNAGLVVDGDQSLLIDTLIDLPLTREMLASMRRATAAADSIGTLVNTHSNPDHTFGNQLVGEATIISSTACLEEMRELKNRPPEMDMRVNWQKLGDAGAFFNEVLFSRFSSEPVSITLPTRDFSGELVLCVGDKEVRLLEVGPAHTRGDVIVYVPGDRTVFTGDIVFVGGHPVAWEGPTSNWIKACDTILSWDVETVVPGHGPVTDKSGVRAMKQYFELIMEEAGKRYRAGLSFEEAARDIRLESFADWIDSERLVINVYACYRELSGFRQFCDPLSLIAATGRYYFEKKASAPDSV